MSKNNLTPMLLCDFYKLSHREQYPQGTEVIYSTWTGRTSRKDGIHNVVAFGFQSFVKEYLIDYFNENFFNKNKVDIVSEYTRIIKNTLGKTIVDTQHIEDLHDLGYFPIVIKAVPEGTLVPIRTPMLTIENTNPKFFWVTNFLETLMSCQLWQPITSATIALQYRKILNKYASETNGDLSGVQFQGHDFSMRGMSSVESAMLSGAGHLLSFTGTDSIPAISYLEQYYNADVEKELVGCSISATEHSVMCTYGYEEQIEAYKRLITEVYPDGFASIVSDTWDLWEVLDKIIKPLKTEILNRDGRIVIRPDSGDPVDIVCGKVQIVDLSCKEYCKTLENCKNWMSEILLEDLRSKTEHGEMGDSQVSGIFKFDGNTYEITVEPFWDRYDKQYYYIDGSEVTKCKIVELSNEQKGVVEILWDIFGGTITDKGYKQLDTHIGCIYGDAITTERCTQICERLKAKGFASTNMVFGIGSYTYQYNTRDTFGFALKSTYAKVNGEERMLFKDPVTDNGVKKSQRGRVVVCNVSSDDDEVLGFKDGFNKQEEIEASAQYSNVLRTIFEDGVLTRDEKLADIRSRLLASLD